MNSSAAIPKGLETQALGWPALLRALWMPILLTWAAMLVSRLGLSLWQAQRVSDAQGWWHIVAQGIRFDGVLMGMVWALPAGITLILAAWPRSWRVWASLLRLYGLVWFVFIVFMEMSTPSFIAQYDSRPNYMFVEYLGYAKEVGGTLLAAYGLQLLAAAISLPLLGWLFWRWSRPVFSQGQVLGQPMHWALAVPAAAMVFCLLAVAGRGDLGRRPANPASAAFSQDHLVNEIPLSSAYTLLYAVRLQMKTGDGGVAYGKMSEDDVIRIMRESTGEQMADFKRADIPLWHVHTQLPASSAKPKNIVIILQESLGAEFVGKLGGVGVTPELDKMAEQGWWLENLYATGTRSVRGIEAVVAGFPPTSAVSTVRLPKSQKGFATLPNVLKRAGYHSTFYYGGDAHFDNMRSYFMGNGFDRIIEQKDMSSDAFIATWGASDEDVFKKAHQTLLAEHGKQPTFSLIFTSSNHSPFEFPDGRIQLHEQPKQTVNNAVKYADWAMGRFIEQARQSPYWKDTIFLIVADHNSRVYGPSLIPIERFHIPGLFLGEGIAPSKFPVIASQIDLAPSLLTLAGITYDESFPGRDLMQPANQRMPGRAIMQFEKIQAYMTGEDVVLLQPDAEPKHLLYKAGKLTETPTDFPPGLKDKAIAQALYARLAYQKQWHRMP
jgi:phosphoglycerol transferase MdoB-like AlkP superfamily enzyme